MDASWTGGWDRVQEWEDDEIGSCDGPLQMEGTVLSCPAVHCALDCTRDISRNSDSLPFFILPRMAWHGMAGYALYSVTLLYT